MITFKQFLTEAPVKVPKKNSNLSDDEHDVIVSTAREMIRGGFAKNYLEMVDGGIFFLRGSDYSANKLGVKMEKTGNMVMGLTQLGRRADRRSTFSQNQFIFNVWHLFDMPSRKRCTLASTNLNMVNEFGQPFIIVPKDGTTLYYITEDWNFSFSNSIHEVFGVDTYIGSLSYIFKVFNQLNRYGAERYSELFYKINDFPNPTLEQFKELCEELDSFLLNVDENTIGKIRDDDNNVRAAYNIWKKVNKGEQTFKMFEDLFNKIKTDVMSTTNISTVITKLKDENSEIWWTGPSYLLLLSKRHAELQELNHVLRSMIGK